MTINSTVSTKNVLFNFNQFILPLKHTTSLDSLDSCKISTIGGTAIKRLVYPVKHQRGFFSSDEALINASSEMLRLTRNCPVLLSVVLLIISTIATPKLHLMPKDIRNPRLLSMARRYLKIEKKVKLTSRHV